MNLNALAPTCISYRVFSGEQVPSPVTSARLAERMKVVAIFYCFCLCSATLRNPLTGPLLTLPWPSARPSARGRSCLRPSLPAQATRVALCDSAEGRVFSHVLQRAHLYVPTTLGMRGEEEPPARDSPRAWLLPPSAPSRTQPRCTQPANSPTCFSGSCGGRYVGGLGPADLLRPHAGVAEVGGADCGHEVVHLGAAGAVVPATRIPQECRISAYTREFSYKQQRLGSCACDAALA